MRVGVLAKRLLKMWGRVLLASSKKSMTFITEKWQYESIRYSFPDDASSRPCPLEEEADINPVPSMPDVIRAFFKKSLLFISSLPS
jgi:hypothetical protein